MEVLKLKKYYVLDSNPYDYKYLMRISIPDTVNIDKRAVYFGKTQYINDETVYLYLEKATLELPDIYNYDLPLISARLKEIMQDYGVSNVFYKPVVLVSREDDNYYQYYVPIIKHIECVKWDKSQYKESTYGAFKEITGSFSIDIQRTGNFNIFKIKDVINEFFVIDDQLKEIFEEERIKGAVMVDTSVYCP